MKVQGFWHDGRFYPIIAGGDGTDDAPPGGDGGDGGDSSGDSTPGDGAGSNGSGDGGGDSSRPSITFKNSQQLGQRLARERAKALEDEAKSHGYTSYAEMKADLAERKAKREKEVGEATTLRTQNAELQKQLDQTNDRARRMSLRHAVELESSRLGFIDPDDAYSLANFTDVEFDDDGEPDRDAIKAVLKDLSKRKPHLVKTDTQDASSTSSRTNGSQQKTSAGSTSSNPPRSSSSSGSLSDDRLTELAKRYPAAGFPVKK